MEGQPKNKQAVEEEEGRNDGRDAARKHEEDEERHERYVPMSVGRYLENPRD